MAHDDEQLNRDIRERLERDYGFKTRTSSGGATWLRGGRCPSCGKKEAYVGADRPRVIRCARANKCGAEFHVKDLYPELFENWSKRHKATPEKPNAAADAYLRDARGFDLARIAGWYIQEHYYDHTKEIGSATVRFPLFDDVWWERIIDQPGRFGDRKATFRGQYGGRCWVPPSIAEAAIPEELWIVEGIFDAIALLHHDVAAVAAMSCNNYPSAWLKGIADTCAAESRDRPKLVWALDGDPAGRRYARQWAKRSKEDGWEVSAAVIAQEGKAKLDWNDMHLRDRLAQKNLEEYRYQGGLLLAETAQEKALLMYRRRGWNEFSFEFDNRLHWFKLDLERYHKVREQYQDDKTKSDEEKRDLALAESNSVVEIANCYPTALYYQANLLTDESWYYFRVAFPHDGPAVNNTFTGGQLASPSEFKKRLLSIAPGAVFTGSAVQLDRMLKRWLERIKTVETVDYIGYTKEHAAWVFNGVAVKDGRTISLNDEDFFDIGRLSIKSLNRSVDLAINTDLKDFTTDWLPLLWACYQQKGIVALAFWLGSLFAEQIRAKQQSFPFMELVGEPGSGKTTLIEFLWRLAGRSDYEGFDPAKSTLAARARNFAQVSNLPVVLIEGDRAEEDRVKQKGFDWDELKPLYNGRSVYSRGMKNSGNETYEPPFRGALVISQNAPVSASEAILQRICHVEFDVASHTPESKAAADKLGQIAVEKVSGFLLKATTAEKKILETFEQRMRDHERALVKLPGIRNQRIVKTHAQLAALVEALEHVVPITSMHKQEALSFIEDMALERQEAINADHPIVQEFWEIFEFIGDEKLNHANDDAAIAISIPQFIKAATDHRQQIPDVRELKKALKTSRVRKFEASNKTVTSAISKDSVKCWIFRKPAAARGAQ